MLKKKVILLFIDWYVPGFKAGGPISSCVNLVDHLSDEFEFRIVTRNTDYTELTPYPEIIPNCWSETPKGNYIYYFSNDRLNYNAISRLISETLFDVVYLNSLYSKYFTLIPLLCLRGRSDKKVVLATRGMLAKSALKVKRHKKKLFLKAVNLFGLFRNVVFHASTENEKADILRELGANNQIMVAENLCPKVKIAKNLFRKKLPGSLKLISIARIAPEKNLMYSLQLLGKMKSVMVQFDIFGPIYDVNYWKACQAIFADNAPGITVNYCGSIEPVHVSSKLSEYHFLLLPTLGENFGHVILQALSSGCPVIISDQTPWKQLNSEKCGWCIPLSEQDSYVRVLTDCANMNQQDFNEMSANAFQFANKYMINSSAENDTRNLFRYAGSTSEIN